jgi:hypothetical protein
MPLSAFDIFVCARWKKALELGQIPPNASRFRTACRIAYDNLPDKTEWEDLAAQEDSRFEREYQEAVERMSHATGSISKELSESVETPDEMSLLMERQTCSSSRTLGTMFSELTLETVWGRPRPCRSLMESDSASLSELAPFVAAVLRDKVVSDLMQETRSLKLEAKEHKAQTRHDRIVRKAIFVIAAGGRGSGSCDAAGRGGSNRHRDSRIFCWATKYNTAGSDDQKMLALLEPEHKCRFRDLLSCQFYIHGQLAGCFAKDASSFAIQVLRNNEVSEDNRGEKIRDEEDGGGERRKNEEATSPDVVFVFTVGGYSYGFSTRCKVSVPDLLLLLGRPDFPSSKDETTLEKEVDLEFMIQNIKMDSRVRFRWVVQQKEQACSRPPRPARPLDQAEEISL